MKIIKRYYSSRLQKKLDLLLSTPLSIIEAPSGYGKTSAVQDTLVHVSPSQIFYSILVDESAVVSYRRLCRELSKIDPKHGAALERIAYPNRSNEAKIVELIQNLETTQPTYLVIDNLQYLQRELALAIIKAFTEISCSNLHVILISLDLSSQIPALQDNPNINLITSEDLQLRPDEIKEYYASEGLQLSNQDAQTIFSKTEGWVVAVALYLRKIGESGEIIHDVDLFDLLDDVFWLKLDEKERHFLLPFAIFDSLTLQRLGELLDSVEENAKLKTSLLRTPLMQFDKRLVRFYPHPILSGFLKSKLLTYPELYRNDLYGKSGALYEAQNRPYEALECYYAINDYEAILKAPLKLLEYQTIAGKDFADIALEIVTLCPKALKEKYPLSLLKLAYYLFNALNTEAFNQTLDEAKEIIWKQNDVQLKGEWYLISAFNHLPNLDKMIEVYQTAAFYFEAPSQIFTPTMPYMFGMSYLWILFYTDAGQGDAIASKLSDMLKLYSKLTDGHGRGADVLYRGELAAMRCQFQKAEILAYEASYIAEESKNVALSFGVALLLGRIAISKMDMLALEKAIEYLETNASAFSYGSGSMTYQVLLESVRSILLAMLGRITETPGWNKIVGNKMHRRGVATLPLAFVSGIDNFMHGEVTRVLGMMEAIDKEKGVFTNAAVRYFINIVMCLSYNSLGDRGLAVAKLDEALSLAEEDELFATLLHYRVGIVPLLKEVKLRARYPDFIIKIEALISEVDKQNDEVADVLAQGKLPNDLSPREEEIARLAARGLRNREIAEKLVISEWTVKNHMQSIYTKLSIDRRSKLLALFN